MSDFDAAVVAAWKRRSPFYPLLLTDSFDRVDSDGQLRETFEVHLWLTPRDHRTYGPFNEGQAASFRSQLSRRIRQ